MRCPARPAVWLALAWLGSGRVAADEFELGAYKTFRAADAGGLDDDPIAALERRNPTQCFTGNDLYSNTKVYCDRQCLSSDRSRADVARQSGLRSAGDVDDAAECEGPWYCSKMRVCHMHKRTITGEEKGDTQERDCIDVRSCANHTQCFPDANQSARMHIAFNVTDANVIEETGFKFKYGGMSFQTTCCVNPRNYRPGIDTPCNAALPRMLRAWQPAAVAAAAVAWALL
ncbi:hypothetical protein M885DRAFT_543505 [Pelagophyceae sp. CCMP2097]|nr:hypothetical protein M885DRAFT_543505 [Pelagophyceae sp. CCMP2097]